MNVNFNDLIWIRQNSLSEEFCKHLIEKFELLKENAKKLDIYIVNLSPVISSINTIPKEAI